MLSIFKKEITSFFSSLIAYIVVAVFLVMTGLFMWVFNETSILNYNYASLDQLFALAPMIFLFLIPAITMRSFAEENQRGTIEFLATFVAIGMWTSSITSNQIVAFILGSFFCFIFHWSFEFLSDLNIFAGGADSFIAKLGIAHHYDSISRGVLDSRDIIYFLSIIFIFIMATLTALSKRKW